MSVGHRYEVLEVVTLDWGTLDLNTVAADMVVENENGATIVVTDPFNVLAGVMDLTQWWTRFGPGEVPNANAQRRIHLESITYTIWALDAEANRLRSQPYKHEFEGKCWVDGGWRLRTHPGPMFGEYELNFLLDTKNFKKQPAIQFIN